MLVSGGVEFNDDVGKANLLNQTFVAKFTDPAVPAIPDVTSSIGLTLTSFNVSEDVVRRLLQDLVVSKACGPDGLSALIPRECANELAVPLCHIFRISISKRIFSRTMGRGKRDTYIQEGVSEKPLKLLIGFFTTAVRKSIRKDH